MATANYVMVHFLRECGSVPLCILNSSHKFKDLTKLAALLALDYRSFTISLVLSQNWVIRSDTDKLLFVQVHVTYCPVYC